ncbi:MAG: efflux RND transporter periplasmic adaptor subunit [Gammaproteobacteria bacterium]|nr:MAG: efflux RND transporter periplasmic adaptor subunit [Gammaproteobacteria bacterium]
MSDANSIRRFVILALTASLLLVIQGCGVGQAGAVSEEQAVAAVPVVTARAIRGDAYAFHAGTVNLEADSEAAVVAKVEGEVRDVLVEEGQTVTAGQVLARLDRDRLSLRMKQARADLTKLQQEYRRNVLLHEKGLVSEGAFENLRFDLEALDADYQLAKLELEYTQIRSPIDGVVSAKLTVPGNSVQKGQVVFQVSDSTTLLAKLHVPQQEFYRFEQGQEAELEFDALPGSVYTAHVLRISPRIDASTGTVKVTLAVSDPERALLPGMFARARIVYETRQDALLIPADAVLAEDAQPSVFVVEDGIAKRRNVTTGLGSGARIEVTSGLEGTEDIVVLGQLGLRDGSAVTSKDEGNQI